MNIPKENKPKKLKGRIILTLLFLILIIILLGQFWLFEVFTFQIKVITSLIILILFLFITKKLNNKRKKTRKLKSLFVIILSIILAYGNIIYFQTNLALLKIMIASSREHVVQIIALKDSAVNDVKDLKQHSIAFQQSDIKFGYLNIVEDLKTQHNLLNNKDYTNKMYVSYTQAYEGLLNHEIDTMVLSLERINAVREQYPNILNNTKVIAEFRYPLTDTAKRVDVSKESFNVLIVGTDAREKDGGVETDTRVDTIILATVNPITKQIILTTLPRDLLIPVSCFENKEDKLTHVGNYGTECLIDTVAGFLNTEINYFIKFNFSALVNLVNTLGGIEVDVQYSFCEQDSLDRPGRICVNQGVQTLDGEDALAYARHRDTVSDYARSDAQKQIIQAVVKETASPSNITKIGSLLETVSSNMLTNMSRSELYDVAMLASSGNAFTFDTRTIEGEGDTRFIELYGQYAFAHIADPTLLETLILELKTVLGMVPAS